MLFQRMLLTLLCALGLSAAFAPDTARAGEITGKGFPVTQSYASPSPVQGALPPVQSYNPATGETTPIGVVPPPQYGTATQTFEAQPINFPDTPRRPRAAAEGGRREAAMPSIWPALFSVLGVCGLFCAALFLVKKYMPGHRQLFNHPAVEVLGRTHLDQKRSISLVRVGKRIIVVGVSADDMRSLSEITDEEEITGILEVARPKTEAGLSLFQKLFRRNVIESEAEEAREMANAKAEELREQMQALRSRVADIAPGAAAGKNRTPEHARRGKQFDAVG